MAERIKLDIEVRTNPAQAVRRDNRIPAIIYGHGLKNINIQVDSQKFTSVFAAAGHTSLINLTIKNQEKEKPHTVIIREVQQHPVRSNILHVDFYQPRLDQKITANVPLRFVGESTAVKDLGGVLVRALDEVELEALPADLPHDIEVDISTLTDFEKAIQVRDLVLSEKVSLNHEPEEMVALVQRPRTEEELSALEEEVSEDVESVEGVEDKEAAKEGDQGETDESGSDNDNKEDSK